MQGLRNLPNSTFARLYSNVPHDLSNRQRRYTFSPVFPVSLNPRMSPQSRLSNRHVMPPENDLMLYANR
ncbi:hypothetical protein BABINDRAFT_97794 [Babjeviella inositovora NRRL Y-12698]|uniref:Uncharacterized protein n=1 Tax=Babjeviella inositovora NRRL Y-12698 TaxID=984486 RepID=A0A1E3QJ48_9ASCO|nr:uncharacterized protein BABINDRAFT_97794 [Babjeviella inositovora NRRL Y-12698]ODQ77721.1 hypothetical protein BABINDRAFT_97794 [Babjeviella inositovora NRRL Y-12698]